MRASLFSIWSSGIDFSPITEISFSSGVCIGFSLIEIFAPESFLSIFIHPFFFAFAIAALNPVPESSFLTWSNDLGSSLMSSISFLSGKPFLNASIPFFPSEIVTFEDSETLASSFNLSHSIPRLIWSIESSVNSESCSGVWFGFFCNDSMIFFSI